MNILFIFHKPIINYEGGVERVTSILSDELVKRNYNIYYLSINVDIRHDSLNSLDRQKYIYGYQNNRKNYIEAYHCILKKYNIQIIICQYFDSKVQFLLRNTPVEIIRIINFHCCPYPTDGRIRIAKKLIHSKRLKDCFFKYLAIAFPRVFQTIYNYKETKLYKEAISLSDKVIFLSTRFCETVIEHVGITIKNQIIAINNPNSFELVTQSLEKENIILCVGRLCEYPKNIQNFIDVWNILSKNNKAWKAYIIGDGYDRQYLEEYACHNNVLNLFFLGTQKDVSGYYAKAKFICMTSLAEGWGMVLTEGMNYGCIPCAYGSYGAVYDIIDDGVNGIISQPFDSKHMASRIQEVIDDNDKFRKMSIAARAKAKEFSVSKTVDKWESLFKSISLVSR